ncbi:ATP-binding protein [Caldimonas sp. KR1-144]|uniref:ATP-binding protein n=1 Tax=Caldimonas sp. KR1-144 TaxID=3400911 RepID=UPI003C0A300F
MNEASPNPAAPARSPWVWTLLAWLAGALLAAGVLWHHRTQTLAAQSREVTLLATALADAIERGLQGAEGGLRALAAQRSRYAAEADDSAALRRGADLIHLVRTLWIFDAEGQARAGSDLTPAPDFRTFAPALARLAPDGAAVSRPYADPVTRENLVALAVPAAAPHQGRAAAGWIVGAVGEPQLLGAFNARMLDAHDRVGIYRDDGVRLAQVHIDEPVGDEAAMALRLARDAGAAARSALDDGERLVAQRRLARYGITVRVSRDRASALADWRSAATVAGATLALLLAVMLGALALAQRAEQRRAQAQQALQARLARAGRLEALGTLAGGVAHDFNNVLGAIVGFGELAQEAAEPGSRQRKHLDKLMHAAERGSALVERILAFSRGGAQAAVAFELEPLVREALQASGASLGHALHFELDARDSGLRVRGDPTQLYEALMNLCRNAAQASPPQGRVQVTIARRALPADTVLSHGRLAAGRYATVAVADQGPGVPADAMEHLFEPFFTTRSREGGTGLGLAMVHGIAGEADGGIDVQNLPEGGACFTLYLPETTQPLAAAEPAPHALPRGQGQRIAVIDDEPALAQLALESLEALGYRVETFTDPLAALDALRAAQPPFDAVVTDEVMPGLSGTQLIETLRREQPSLPVLLLSGYGGAMLAARAAAAGAASVLSKPARRAELAAALRAALPA